MIDCRSDTVTKPDGAMRDRGRTADVGDDVYGEDPTVNELEARAAERVGMDAALFVPTGTMGNQIAARVHTDHGQEVIADRQSHVVKYELGGLAQHSGLQVRMTDAPRGVPDRDQLEAALVEEDLHRPGTGLFWLENTHNARGGIAIDPDTMSAAAETARDHGVAVHLDGARVFNAATALEVPVTELTEPVDSVMFCLSKGLGAPVGSILAGESTFINRARRVRKSFGGGMRQAGVIAAPGLSALENVDDLAIDHDRAARLADGLDGIAGLEVAPPESNIVIVDVTEANTTPAEFCSTIEEYGVLASPFGPTTVRFCTHRDLDDTDVEAVVERVESAMA